MPRFKKHTIVYGDTPQLIAEQEMGDVSKWIELVKKNDLHYPYIVDTPEERNKDIHHLVTIGNTIIIPEEKTLSDIDTDQIPKYDKLVLEEIVLGNDLKFNITPEDDTKHGADDEILSLTGNGKGDLALAKGKDNIVQTLKLRLLTPKGSLILHPNYGSNLQSLVGEKNTQETAEEINSTIEEELQADPRIRSANLDGWNLSAEYYLSSWTVKLQDFETYFKLLIQRDNDNNFLIM